jgi:hypothetical protein
LAREEEREVEEAAREAALNQGDRRSPRVHIQTEDHQLAVSKQVSKLAAIDAEHHIKRGGIPST